MILTLTNGRLVSIERGTDGSHTVRTVTRGIVGHLCKLSTGFAVRKVGRTPQPLHRFNTRAAALLWLTDGVS